MIFYPTPNNCDVCGTQLTDEMYDAKTKGGPWGCLCPGCFILENGQLGLGKGQHYKRNVDDGKFHMVVTK